MIWNCKPLSIDIMITNDPIVRLRDFENPRMRLCKLIQLLFLVNLDKFLHENWSPLLLDCP